MVSIGLWHPRWKTSLWPPSFLSYGWDCGLQCDDSSVWASSSPACFGHWLQWWPPALAYLIHGISTTCLLIPFSYALSRAQQLYALKGRGPWVFPGSQIFSKTRLWSRTSGVPVEHWCGLSTQTSTHPSTYPYSHFSIQFWFPQYSLRSFREPKGAML